MTDKPDMTNYPRKSIDDLIEKITAQGLDAPDTTGTFPIGYAEGAQMAVAFIRDNRPAIEKGIQKPLSFRFSEGYWIPIPVSKDEDYISYGNDGILRIIKFTTRLQCEIFAKSLGLTAEFVEAKDEG